jgi:hypothetical protein
MAFSVVLARVTIPFSHDWADTAGITCKIFSSVASVTAKGNDVQSYSRTGNECANAQDTATMTKAVNRIVRLENGRSRDAH